MTPEQALGVLQQAFVIKPGLTLQDINLIMQAWQILIELIKKNEPAKNTDV